MKKRPSFLWIVVLLLFVGCRSGETRLREAEQRLGTQGVDDWVYHRLPEDPYGLGLSFPGYVIAFEKTDRVEKLGLKPYEDDSTAWGLTGPKAFARPAENKRINGWLSDRQQAFLSHIVRYRMDKDPNTDWGAIRPELLYSAYRDVPCVVDQPCRQLHARGVDVLGGAQNLSGGSTLLEAIEADIQSTGATHLILYSMGWNTDQQEALRNYNSLVGNLRAVAGPQFRPLVIAITWDSLAGSSWSRVITYPWKAADGDEVGAVWVNRLLREVLIPIRENHSKKSVKDPSKKQSDLRLVLIGHSFGARVVTRALFSYPLLGIADNVVSPKQVDLVLALQGAFSVNRFIDSVDVGMEGAPYRRFPYVAKKFALTWSSYDTANPKAIWFSQAKHAGGSPGFRRAQRFSRQGGNQPETFELAAWKCATPSSSSPSPPCRGDWEPGAAPTQSSDRVAMIDASSIIRFPTNQKGGKAHSDIYNPDMAELIWRLIRDFAGN